MRFDLRALPTSYDPAMTPDSRTMTFETPAPAKLRLDIPHGRITVTAEETAVTRIEL